VSAQGIAQHRALAHQQLPGPVQHQPFVFIGTNRIDSRVTASQIAARIIRIVLAAFEIGLHVARRHQPDRVAKRL